MAEERDVVIYVPSTGSHSDCGLTEKIPRPHRLGKRWLCGAAILIVLILLLILFLPSLLSTGFGTNLVLWWVNRLVPGRVMIEDLDLAWSRGQYIGGLSFVGADGVAVMTVDAVEASEVSLWSVLRGDRHFGRVKLVNLNGEIDQLGDIFGRGRCGTRVASKSDRRPSEPRKTRRVVPDVSIKIEVVDGRFRYVHEKIEEMIEVLLLAAVVEVLDPSHIEVSLKVKVKQADHQGQIEVDLAVHDLFDTVGLWQAGAFTLEGQAKAAGVPVALFDRIFKLDGLLESLLGPVLQAELAVKGDLEDLTAMMHAEGERFAVCGELVSRNSQVTVQPGAKASLHVGKEVWPRLACLLSEFGGVRLVQPVDFEASLAQLQIAIDRTKNRAWLRKIDAKITASQILLDAGSPVGQVGLKNTTIALTSDARGDRVEAILSAVAEHDVHAGRIRLAADVYRAFDSDGNFNRQGLRASLTGRLSGVATVVVDQFLPKPRGLVLDAVGRTVEINVGAELDPLSSDGRFLVPYRLSVVGSHLDAKFDGTVVLEQRSITSSGSVDWQIVPVLVKRWIKSYGDQLPEKFAPVALAEVPNVKLQVTDLTIPLPGSPVQAIGGGFSLRVDQIVPAGVDVLKGISVKNLRIDIPLASLSMPFRLTGSGEIHDGRDLGTWHLDGQVTRLSGPVLADFTVIARDVSTPMIEQLIGKPGRLVPLLSPKLDSVTIAARHDPAQPGKWSVQIASHSASQMEMELKGDYVAGESIAVQAKSFVRFNLSPQVFASWMAAFGPKGAQPKWQLDQPARLNLVFKPSRIVLRPMTDGVHPMDRIHPALSWLGFELITTHLALRRHGEAETLSLDSFTVELHANDLRKPIAINLRSKSEKAASATDQQQTFMINSTNRLGGLFNALGRYDPEHAMIDTKTHADLSMDLVDSILCQNGLWAAVLGSTARVNIEGRINRTQISNLDLQIIAAHARVKLAGHIGPTAVFCEEGYFELDVTPQLSDLVLKKLNPVISAVSAKDPVKVVVSSQGFSLPVKDFDYAKVIGDFTLELGTLMLDRSKQVGGAALELLVGGLSRVVKFKSMRSGTQHTAVFTPLRVHLQDGVVSYRDMAMTLDGIVLTFRGRVDVPNDRVDLVLGLSGQTFQKNRLLARYVRPQDTFELPMAGSIRDVELDWDAFVQGLFGRGVDIGLSELRRKNKDLADVLDVLFGRSPAISSDAVEGTGLDREVGAGDERRLADPIEYLFWDIQRRKEEKARKNKEKKQNKKKMKKKNSDKNSK